MNLRCFLCADGPDGGAHVARGCVYYKAKFCKTSKTIESCKTCVFDGCNGSTSLKSSAVPIITIALAVTLRVGISRWACGIILTIFHTWCAAAPYTVVFYALN